MTDDIKMVQQTLSGGKQLITDIQEIRGTLDTFLWCETCEDKILRSYRSEHPHPLVSFDEFEDEEEDDPERVGSMYRIELSYTVEYAFHVPAWNEHQAEERAKDLQLDATPADKMHVHTRQDERKTIMSDDDAIPDDWDPYGSTPLWEVYGDD